MSADQYPWNVHVSVGGVSFTGPGMESRTEADAIADIVEDEIDGDVEVIRQ
jgi:hypothetical protein